jgi:hypothetical protein
MTHPQVPFRLAQSPEVIVVPKNQIFIKIIELRLKGCVKRLFRLIRHKRAAEKVVEGVPILTFSILCLCKTRPVKQLS